MKNLLVMAILLSIVTSCKKEKFVCECSTNNGIEEYSLNQDLSEQSAYDECEEQEYNKPWGIKTCKFLIK